MNLINPHLVELQLEVKSKEEALVRLAQKLTSEGYVKKSFLEAVLTREKEFPTGLPTSEIGIAIPHTNTEHVLKPGIAVASLKSPIEFNVMGDSDSSVDVMMIFMLAINDSKKQLDLLKKLVMLFQNNSLLRKLLQTQDKSEFAKLVDTFFLSV